MMMVTLIWVFVGCLIWNALKQIRISKYKIDVNDYDTYRERQKELKKYEAEDRIRLPNIIVVQINGRNFRRFSEDHNFKLPSDENAMNLMKACAVSMLEKFPDIIFSYGFDDEYSFVFRRNTKFYQRRASKLLSVITSSFMSEYVFKWEEFFPTTSLAYSPSFCGRILACASIHVLQQYLSWRQYNYGHVMPSWFNIHEIPVTADSPKDERAVLKAVQNVHAMIDKEVAAGTNPNNIFVCGFSQGGALTLASVLLYPKTLGGGAIFSGWVPFNSSLIERITPDAKKTPILWNHGMADKTVLFEAGQAGPPFLEKAGISCEFNAYPGLAHSISSEELRYLESWIKPRLQSSS